MTQQESTTKQIDMYDLATGESTRVDLPSPDALAVMGTRERYAWENAARCGTSITPTQLSHARHIDGCKPCQADEQLTNQRDRAADRDHQESAHWRLNIGELIRQATDRPETTVPEMLAALGKITRAAARIRKQKP